MSTAFIIFSVFFTGAIVSHKEAGPSNTLMVFALGSLATGVGLWVKAQYFPGA